MFHFMKNCTRIINSNNKFGLNKRDFHKIKSDNSNVNSNDLSRPIQIQSLKNKNSLSLFILSRRNLNFYFTRLSRTFNNNNSFSNPFLQLSKKNFSSTAVAAEDEILLTQGEALLMNEHDRICILLTHNSVAKENIINFINELLDICLKLRRYANYMQGWEILMKFVLQNLNNFNNTDFLKFLNALGTVIIPNDTFWKNVANNLLSRNLAPDEFVKVLLIVSKYNQEKSFYEKVCEIVKEYKLFSDSKASEEKKDENQESLNYSNSLVLFHILSQNLIKEGIYNNENKIFKDYVDEFIVKKTLALLVTENILDKLNKKDLAILLRICGHIFNYKAFKDSISTKPLDDFIQQIILYINKVKADNKNQNLIVMLFLMIKNIEYLFEKDQKIFENLILTISENYKSSNDLLKYAFYLELLEICATNQKMYKILAEKSVKSADNNEDLFFIKQLAIPNEEFLDQYSQMTQNLKNETSVEIAVKIKKDFFKKHYSVIGIPKDKVEEYIQNNYAMINCLNYIFG